MGSGLENAELDLDQIYNDLFETYCSTCSDLLTQNLKDRGLEEPLRRLVLIGRLKYVNRNEVKMRHDEMIKLIQENILDDSSKISGIMIVQKTFFYHVVEGSDKALSDVIQSTSNLSKRNLIIGAKVIRNSSILLRYFDKWNSCVIFSTECFDSQEEMDAVTESDFPSLVNMVKKFEKVIFVIAAYVRHLKLGEIDEKINELVSTNVLPFDSELEDLYKESFFLTVEKYCERYLQTYIYTSYLEEEWPPTGPVHDAKDYFQELEVFERNIDIALFTEEEQKRKKARYGTWWWT